MKPKPRHITKKFPYTQDLGQTTHRGGKLQTRYRETRGFPQTDWKQTDNGETPLKFQGKFFSTDKSQVISVLSEGKIKTTNNREGVKTLSSTFPSRYLLCIATKLEEI